MAWQRSAVAKHWLYMLRLRSKHISFSILVIHIHTHIASERIDSHDVPTQMDMRWWEVFHYHQRQRWGIELRKLHSGLMKTKAEEQTLWELCAKLNEDKVIGLWYCGVSEQPLVNTCEPLGKSLFASVNVTPTETVTRTSTVTVCRACVNTDEWFLCVNSCAKHALHA